MGIVGKLTIDSDDLIMNVKCIWGDCGNRHCPQNRLKNVKGVIKGEHRVVATAFSNYASHHGELADLF